MKTRFGFAGVAGVSALVLGLAGCGAGGASRGVEAPSAEWAHGEPAPAGAAAPPVAAASEFGQAAPAPAATPAPGTPSGETRRAERAPSERPGLGTEWGEALASRVHEVPFDRESDPFALASIRYDDRAGVDALVKRHQPVVQSTSGVAVANGWVSMYVLGENGNALNAVQAGGRTYVVGRAGERYSILLANQTSRRLEAVATVDGLDVMNGRAGSLSNRGYLLEPHTTFEIEGFRQSDDTVAAFRFGRVGDSYAAQTGSAREVGVIGVAFFGERGERLREEEARSRDTATPFPADDRYAHPPR